MDSHRLIDRMARFPGALDSLLVDAPPEDARWKPSRGDWSILEIVCHLCDEEVEDFRVRLRMTLEAPGEPWPPIDPERAVVDRRCNARDLVERLACLAQERRASVEWLRSQSPPDWSIAHEHPKLGPIRAGDLLLAWAAHDALHLRQVARRLHQLAQRYAPAFGAGYAGEW